KRSDNSPISLADALMSNKGLGQPMTPWPVCIAKVPSGPMTLSIVSMTVSAQPPIQFRRLGELLKSTRSPRNRPNLTSARDSSSRLPRGFAVLPELARPSEFEKVWCGKRRPHRQRRPGEYRWDTTRRRQNLQNAWRVSRVGNRPKHLARTRCSKTGCDDTREC